MSNHYIKGNDHDRYAKSGLTVEVKNGNIDRAMRTFKKKCTEAGIVQEVRDRKQFEKPSAKRRTARKAGRQRWLRTLRELNNR
jgi:small subunit ribosomal protein S21